MTAGRNSTSKHLAPQCCTRHLLLLARLCTCTIAPFSCPRIANTERASAYEARLFDSHDASCYGCGHTCDFAFLISCCLGNKLQKRLRAFRTFDDIAHRDLLKFERPVLMHITSGQSFHDRKNGVTENSKQTTLRAIENVDEFFILSIAKAHYPNV